MSIQSQAEFWFRNVCDVSKPAEDIVCKEAPDKDALLEGMQAYSDLLREIYTNYFVFEVSTVERVMTKIGIWADDLDNYHNMTNLGKCLLDISRASELKKDGLAYCLYVDKTLFKKYFKKPPTFYFNLMQQYGFYFLFYKNEKKVSNYSGSDVMEHYNENHNSLLYAMWYFSKRVAEKDSKDVVIPSATAFLLADYDTLCFGSRTNKEIMYDLPQPVLNCVGDKRDMIIQLVSKFCGESKLRIDLTINTYVFPNWIIKFKQGKKTISTFHVRADSIATHLPLTYEVAKQVIDRKDKFTQGVLDSISRFGCAGCGKCVGASNLTTYNGYRLCSLPFSNFTTEYSRLIQMELKTQADADAICWMIEALLAEK